MNAVPQAPVPAFSQTLRAHGLGVDRRPLEILQINVGKRCNQACHHCHVEAGPKRTEIMNADTVARVIELLRDAPGVHTVDITGGAPELNPHFRELVVAARALGKKVIDRCNLTVLFEDGQEDTAEFLAAQGVTVVASLPCYTRANVEKQRGLGVFEPSIAALRRLNTLGYGRAGSSLELDLVYNPVGAFLPGPQAALEADYKRELAEHFGIVFNRLYTITNMPISRFLHMLERDGLIGTYMHTLLDAFNPAAALGVMCRNLLSVGWDGQLYDCDFNQMLELPLARRRRTLWDIERLADIDRGPIAFGAHCYGCTAGAGSSCGGALA
ncbi:MAG TPA: arsenosugar biosynthesis radical SAM (seleno)protein ArsS [Rhodanobacteraceae bacterium]|nr:arsenosugar biosynthesis radical SAM (seleno)protein ArsS [Rhodanobacteraceae bacterium]